MAKARLQAFRTCQQHTTEQYPEYSRILGSLAWLANCTAICQGIPLYSCLPCRTFTSHLLSHTEPLCTASSCTLPAPTQPQHSNVATQAAFTVEIARWVRPVQAGYIPRMTANEQRPRGAMRGQGRQHKVLRCGGGECTAG